MNSFKKIMDLFNQALSGCIDLQSKGVSPEILSNFALMAHPSLRPRLLAFNRTETLIAYGAFWVGRPAGVALASLFHAESTAQILSLYVSPDYRKQGLGRLLLNHVEKAAKQKNIKTLLFRSLKEKDTESPAESFLIRAGWPPFSTDIYLARSLIADSADDYFVKTPLKIPENSEIFQWVDLSEVEKQEIAAKQGQPGWYDNVTSPFLYEDYIHPLTSLGIRYKGEVVGWMITHQMSSEVLRYSSWFVKSDMRLSGIAGALISHAFHRQVFFTNMPIASLQMQPGNKRMDLFIKKKVAHYLTHFLEQRTSRKSLASPT